MGKINKVVVVGGRSVGKTSILERAILGLLRPEKPYIPTIEDIYCGSIETERNHREKIRFYDTAGLDSRNRNLLPHYHSIADAYLLVFSFTDRASFQLISDVKKDIERNKEKKEVPIVVLGNKTDLASQRVVANEMAENLISAEFKSKLWETCIHDRSTLTEPLVYLASRLSPQPNRSSFPQLSMGRKNKD